MSKVRLLVVDDSPLIRRVVTDMLTSEPDFEVIGQARDGQEAVRLTAELRPDVITLDVEMPRMDGLEALRQIMRNTPTPVVMLSSLTSSGTAATMDALHAGAVDCVAKPNHGSLASIRLAKDELIAKIRGAVQAKISHRGHAAVKTSLVAKSTDRVVLVASSTGGPRALHTLFEGLPHEFPAPILIVQHMPPGFLVSLARRLQSIGTVPCGEAKPGDRVTPGMALFAPAGKHMRVGPGGVLEFDETPARHGVRPSADPLFESAAEVYGERCVAAVLTGMGRDGAEGARAIKRVGGTVFAEDASTCTIYGMPRAAVVTGAVDLEVPIDRMGEAIAAAVSAPRRVRRAS